MIEWRLDDDSLWEILAVFLVCHFIFEFNEIQYILFVLRMKIESRPIKQLKKFDDTNLTSKKTKPVKKHAQPKKTSKAFTKNKKLCPEQTILQFKSYTLKYKKQEVRIPCYEESQMGWPNEFTQKLRQHSMDNDQQSDDQIIAHEIKKGIQSLSLEISFKKIQQLEDTIGF